MVPDRGQSPWVQRLNHQRRQATHHHGGKIGMDLPDNGVGTEQARVAKWLLKLLQRRRRTRHVLKPFSDGIKSQRLHDFDDARNQFN